MPTLTGRPRGADRDSPMEAIAGPAAESSGPAGGAAWPLVSVIVVNYNGGERVRRCLRSLLACSYPATEALVVDNASTDDSLTNLAAMLVAFPQVRLLRSDTNLGYAGGVNLALESAHGDFVAVLNMDVVLEPGWLEPLVAYLVDNPRVGAVNPLIALNDGERVNAAGQDVHLTGLGFNRGLGRTVTSVGHAPLRVSGLHGCAFVIRRGLLQRLGGMDATGFLYHEDVNLSWLLQLAGHELFCIPASVIRHDYLLSMYPAKLHLLERNRWAMLLSYLRWPTLLLLAPLLAITEGLVWGYCLLRGRAFQRAKLASYAWVFRSRGQIQARRRLAESVRVVSDVAVLNQLRWAYTWDQFVVLGRERGPSRRQPVGGLPAVVVPG